MLHSQGMDSRAVSEGTDEGYCLHTQMEQAGAHLQMCGMEQAEMT